MNWFYRSYIDSSRNYFEVEFLFSSLYVIYRVNFNIVNLIQLTNYF